jgi:hypothetical protein
VATITTLEGFGSRRVRLNGRRGHGSPWFFGDVASDRALVEAQLVTQQTYNHPPTRQGFITGGRVDWGALYVASPDWARAAYASINQGALDPDSFPTIDAWMQKYGRPLEDARAKAEADAREAARQEAAGRAMKAAQDKAMEEARLRAEDTRIRAEAEMRARALAAKAKAYAEEQARAKVTSTPVYTQVGYPNTPLPPPETGPGLLPPVSTTPPLLVTSTPVDVVTSEESSGEAKKPSYLFPLLALGAAYLVLKG